MALSQRVSACESLLESALLLFELLEYDLLSFSRPLLLLGYRVLAVVCYDVSSLVKHLHAHLTLLASSLRSLAELFRKDVEVECL